MSPLGDAFPFTQISHAPVQAPVPIPKNVQHGM
jgi:hypothetical protein